MSYSKFPNFIIMQEGNTKVDKTKITEKLPPKNPKNPITTKGGQQKEENSKTSSDDKTIINKISTIKVNEQEEEDKTEKEIKHIDRENKNIIQHYGQEIYDYSKELDESGKISSDFLSKHKIDSKTRTKMVDWLIEVLEVYHADAPTLFLTVQIMDSFLSKNKSTLTNNDVHLIGICSVFLASKMEDIIPLRMSHVKSKIGHNKFTEQEIKKKEKEILQTINFDLIGTSTFDFIKTFFYDFCHNNKPQIVKLGLMKHIENFSNTCIFLAKMMLHSDIFLSLQLLFKICCLYHCCF